MIFPAPETLTSTSLLDRLAASSDQTIWREYVDRYRPRIVRYLGRLGLAGADAEDTAQQALMEFAEGLRAGRYDRERGRLRSWLFGIVSNHLRNVRRRVAGQPLSLESLDRALEGESPDPLWEDEWRRSLLRQALRQVRAEVHPETWRAFEAFGLGEQSAATVAEELGMKRMNVFAAKRRVLERVRVLLPQLDEET